MTAYEAAMAMFAEQSAAYQASVARKASDRHLQFLKALHAQMGTRIDADGIEGGRQMFASLVSAEHMRKVRVGKLIVARERQLDGYGVRGFLAAAADVRKVEKRRAAEAALDADLAYLAREHAEGRVGSTPVCVDAHWSRPVIDPGKLGVIAAAEALGVA